MFGFKKKNMRPKSIGLREILNSLDVRSDGCEGAWPAFYRDLNAARSRLRWFLDVDRVNICKGPDAAKIELASDCMSAKLDDGCGRTILYRVGRIEFED